MITFIQICPLELFEQIIEDDKFALSRLTCVHREFNALIEAYVKKYPIKEYFGKEEWMRYGISLKKVSRIPLKFYQLFDPSKYILTFIPKNIGKRNPLTLKSFDRFALKILENQYNIQLNERESILIDVAVNLFWLFAYHELTPSNKPTIYTYNGKIKEIKIKKNESHWVMLSKNNLKEREGNFEVQGALIKAQGYEIPKLVDTVVSVVMHYFKTGEECYQFYSTRVQEKNHKGSEHFVGEFRRGFINVSDNYNFTNGSAYALTSI